MEQKIIIVGASSGIGKRMAEQYAAAGNRVGITARRLELLQAIQLQHSNQIEVACFDVRDDENIPKLEELVTRLGGLDILIICAGVGQPSTGLDWEIDRMTVSTNVDGFVAIANWAFNFFIKKGDGRLATISSIAAVRGGSHAPAYNASKAFQSSYFEGLSIKARRMKIPIGVTCIEPGFVDSKMAKGEHLFWLVPLDKAARQIRTAIWKKRRKAYISRRWGIIAQLLKWTPYWIYRRIG